MYRVDATGPNEVFASGFSARDPSTRALDEYQLYNVPSDFVGTSLEPDFARMFGRTQGWRYEVQTIGGIEVTASTGLTYSVRSVNADGTLGEEILNPNFRPLE